MAAVLRVLVLALLAGATACASGGGDNGERRSSARRASESRAIQLEALPAQPLDPGQCGLFLWAQSLQTPSFIFVAYDDPAEAWVQSEGDDKQLPRTSFEGQVRLGHFERQSFANDDLRVIVDLKFDDQRAMQDGIAIERGTLRVQDRAGWEAVMPVGGMVACER